MPKTTKSRRAGTAMCEFAICFPVLMVLVFGSIEVTNQVFANQGLVASAYECARVTASTGSKDQGLNRANEVLTARNLSSAQISFQPSNITGLAVGQPFEVTVKLHSSYFSMVPDVFQRSNWIEAHVSMVKEIDD